MKNTILSSIRKHGNSLSASKNGCYFSGNIPSDKLHKAIKKYATGVHPEEVLFLYDASLLKSGSGSFLLTANGVWSSGKANFFSYRHIDKIDVSMGKLGSKITILFKKSRTDEQVASAHEYIQYSNEHIEYSEFLDMQRLILKNSTATCSLSGCNPEVMKHFLDEVCSLYSICNETTIMATSQKDSKVNAGESKINIELSQGRKDSDYFTNAVNATHLEKDAQFQKYHNTRGGHGWAAEDANALHDIFQGKAVHKIGSTNELNGADRISDGILIQTKYYQSASQTLGSIFDGNGNLRYPGQVLEVPKDQYDEVCNQLNKLIQSGDIIDVNGNKVEIKDANEVIKEGHVTYKQARNIAKAGNIDSIKFDAVNQVITTSLIIGVSAAINTAINMWLGKQSLQTAMRDALASSLEAGQKSFIVGVLSAQALRTKSAAAGTMIVRPGVKVLYKTNFGKLAIEKIAAASLGKSVSGAAAVNHISKLLRSNVITGTITLAVITTPGFYRSCFDKSESWSQFFKNLSVAIMGIAGGTAGWAGGAVAGAAAGSVVPGVGTAAGAVAGGLVGAFGGGVAASVGAKFAADKIVDDDSVQLIQEVQDALSELAQDYLLSEEEVNGLLLERVKLVMTSQWLRQVYKSGQKAWMHKWFVYTTFEPLCSAIVASREKIHISEADATEQTAIFLEELGVAFSEESQHDVKSDD